jgi:hypothetical protein
MSEPGWVIAERERVAANANLDLQRQASPEYYEPPWTPTAEQRADAERQAEQFRAEHAAELREAEAE